MKTPKRTTLPINPSARAVHALKHSIFHGFAFYAVFCFCVYCVFLNCWYCWNPPAPEGMPVLVVSSMASILFLALMIPAGDIYFYERYVEIRRILPFMKRQVIYYDKMHVHITKGLGLVILNHYEIPPKFWDAPYTWVKIYYSDGIYFYFVHTPEANPPRLFFQLLLEADPEILEFVKTKARSVSYR